MGFEFSGSFKCTHSAQFLNRMKSRATKSSDDLKYPTFRTEKNRINRKNGQTEDIESIVQIRKTVPIAYCAEPHDSKSDKTEK